MNDKDLNQILIDIDCMEHKPIPYIGWWWKNTDFNGVIKIAVIPRNMLRTNSHYVGVVFDNVWGYPEYELDRDETVKFRNLVENYVQSREHFNTGIIEDFLLDTLQVRYDVLKKCNEWPVKQMS